jgi:hypothetical protein
MQATRVVEGIRGGGVARLWDLVQNFGMESLTAMIARGPISTGALGTILEDVFAALEGGVDRALTSERVLVDEAMHARLGPVPPRSALVPGVWDENIIHRFAFMAPEQVRGKSGVDVRADIYAIGAIAFHALMGTLPFVGTNALAMIALKLERPPPPLGDAFSPLLQSFVRIAMAIEPKDRYPRLNVARLALRAAL